MTRSMSNTNAPPADDARMLVVTKKKLKHKRNSGFEIVVMYVFRVLQYSALRNGAIAPV